MKIAICVHNLTGGGAERVASLWVKGFSKSGDDVCVIISDNRANITYTLPSNVRLYSIDVNGGNRVVDFFKRLVMQPYKLHAIFKSFNPDIVIAVMPDWGPLIFRSKGSMSFKTIGTDHNSYERPDNAPMPKAQWKLKFETNKKFDHVTVLTKADFDYIGNRLSNVTVLPNPLAFEPIDYEPVRKKRVLAVGTIDSWYIKGFDLLIEAFSKVAITYPEWELCIMGRGSEYNVQYLQDIAERNGLKDRFSIIPYQSNPLPIYRESEVFCLSSRYEGFGMVLIEAMSQGCACIACDYKGRQAEIINDEKCGILCRADDVDELAKSIDKMLSDENYRKTACKAAIERSRYYDLDKTMIRWNDIIKKILVK